jgi:hypothetical protein
MRFRSLLLLGALLVMAAGCRFKSWESFQAATTPNPPGEWKGDPYAAGGPASATGGTKTETTYNPSAKRLGTTDDNYDSPAKGSGTIPGEPTVSNRNAQGNNNGAAFTDTPGSVGTPGVSGIR